MERRLKKVTQIRVPPKNVSKKKKKKHPGETYSFVGPWVVLSWSSFFTRPSFSHCFPEIFSIIFCVPVTISVVDLSNSLSLPLLTSSQSSLPWVLQPTWFLSFLSYFPLYPMTFWALCPCPSRSQVQRILLGWFLPRYPDVTYGSSLSLFS